MKIWKLILNFLWHIFRNRNVKSYEINNKVEQKRHIWTGLVWRMEDGRYIKEEIKMEKILTKTSEEWYSTSLSLGQSPILIMEPVTF